MEKLVVVVVGHRNVDSRREREGLDGGVVEKGPRPPQTSLPCWRLSNSTVVLNDPVISHSAHSSGRPTPVHQAMLSYF